MGYYHKIGWINYNILLRVLFTCFNFFLGGVMILIAYINILSANEKFEMPSTSPNTLAILPFTLIIFIGLLPDFYKTIKISKISNYANALYLNNNSILTLFLMMYLLIAIICVVKIVKCERGPLVKRL